MTTLSATGTLLSQQPFLHEQSAGRPAFWVCNRNGLFGFVVLSWPSPQTASARTASPVFMWSDPSAPPVQLGTVPGVEMTRTPSGEWLPRPLGRQPHLALGQARLFVGSADSGFVTSYDVAGSGTRAIKFAVRPRRVSAEHVEAALEEMAGPVAGATRDTVIARLRGLDAARVLPAYTGLIADEYGVLWIVQGAPGEARLRRLAVDETGKELADLWVPGTRVYDIGRDHVLAGGAVDGMPSIAKYRLHRRGR
ncbi:MAG: hypothetical protein IT361_17650 [Gemmatimonadaceae bacterium]|nr:hypothetical protein [Gemmatimonadaceae bacterium]